MPDPSHILQPVLHLIFSEPEILLPEDRLVEMRLLTFDTVPQKEAIDIHWVSEDPSSRIGRIHFGQHHVQVSSLPHPLPSAIIDRTIHTAPWQPQVKMHLRHHQSHLSLVYMGDHHDPVEKMIALYQVAHSLANENLLGIVNEPAWTAHPTADILMPDQILNFRQNIPFRLWVGYVRFFVDKKHYWLVTKGHHLFNVPDLAYFCSGDENEEDIISQFNNIFYYIFEEDADVVPGDTFSVSGGDDLMQFSEVTEYPELLMGPIGTLVISKVNTRD